MKDKKALITGSGTGIGKAIAYRFAEARANLELVDIDKERLTVCAAELQQFGVTIGIHSVDLSKKDEIDALWRAPQGKEPTFWSTMQGFIRPNPFWKLTKLFSGKSWMLT